MTIVAVEYAAKPVPMTTMCCPGTADVIRPLSVVRSSAACGGVPGTGGAVGVTSLDGPAAVESPTVVDSEITVIVYVTPAVPPMRQVVAPVVVQVAGPGLAMARYPVIPVVTVGALQDAVIDDTPATAVTPVGGSTGVVTARSRVTRMAALYVP